MTRFLINEAPLQIFPTLARKIGLNEAIVLQQMHYWLHLNGNNQHEVYNTSEQWQKQFPFWSLETIKHTIVSLKRQNLIIDIKINQNKSNQCLRYTINYKALEDIKACGNRLGQIDTIEDNSCPSAHGHKEYFYES